jgi:hypothetical protein
MTISRLVLRSNQLSVQRFMHWDVQLTPSTGSKTAHRSGRLSTTAQNQPTTHSLVRYLKRSNKPNPLPRQHCTITDIVRRVFFGGEGAMLTNCAQKTAPWRSRFPRAIRSRPVTTKINSRPSIAVFAKGTTEAMLVAFLQHDLIGRHCCSLDTHVAAGRFQFCDTRGDCRRRALATSGRLSSYSALCTATRKGAEHHLMAKSELTSSIYQAKSFRYE